MTLKRITACILCLILAMALTAPAVADEYSESNVTISYDLKESFTMQIPTTVSLEPDTNNGNLTNNLDITISADLKEGAFLGLSVCGSDYCDQTKLWYLSNKDSSSDSKIWYSITMDGQSIIPNDVRALEVHSGHNVFPKSMIFTAPYNKNPYIAPGNYSSTLTFVLVKR